MLKQIIFTLLSAFVLSVTSQAAVFHWDCTKSPEACQNYCFAAFCRNKGGPYTYSRAGNADRRRESGVAGASPCSQARRGGALRWGGDAGNRWPNALIECDEWPPASTTQGGAGSMLRCIPKSDNGSGGGSLGAFTRRTFPDGDGDFNVVLANSDVNNPASYCKRDPDCTNDPLTGLEFTFTRGGHYIAARSPSTRFESAQNTSKIEPARFLTSRGEEVIALIGRDAASGIELGSDAEDENGEVVQLVSKL